ncbi:uncharacterized protein [Fopius arisanus]|uniref:Uncharacterized protein isoform X1 n=1 Tax=Fopius arisanus TaxID=64838 RepID=A0A9R1TWL0_9HYME|nr:PREDICTED: uncharacterized protein LOC105265033 isoform X1 [Fopius arisanus]
MREESESILSDLYVLHRKTKYGETPTRHWTTYVGEVIKNFEESLVRNMRGTMLSILQFFRGKPLLHVEVDLSPDYFVTFNPDIKEIDAALNSIVAIPTQYIYSTDEFIRILKFGKLSETNDNFVHFNEAVEDLASRVKIAITSGLKDIEEFIIAISIAERISIIHDTVKSFAHEEREELESAIQWCEEILEMAHNLENAIRINFVLLNTQSLKIRVSTECENLKDLLFVELSKFIASELALERIQTDDNT